jgi:hypothetical protein
MSKKKAILREKLELLAKTPAGSLSAHKIIASLEVLREEDDSTAFEEEIARRLEKLVKTGNEDAKQNGVLALAILSEESNECMATLSMVKNAVPISNRFDTPIKIFTSSEDAKREIADWKSSLWVKLENKYKPSGKTTLRALGLMLAITLLASPILGGAMGLAFIAIEKLFSFFFYLLAKLFGDWFVFQLIMSAIVYLFPYGCMGYAIGKIEAETGKSVNNRNIYIAILFSIIATMIGSFMFDQTRYWIVGMERTIIIKILGFILAPIVAAVTSVSIIYRQKFCEGCKMYLKRNRSVHMPLPVGKTLVDIIDSRAFTQLHEPLKQLTNDLNKYCFISLHTCPNCNNGFLEALAHIRSSWRGNGSEIEAKEAKWMFRSIKINSAEAIIIKPLLT